jgi:hypothetical protein
MNTNNIFNFRDTEVVIYNISSMKDSRCPQPSVKYKIVHKVILRHTCNSETIVNFEPKSNCQYHLSPFVRNWQNTFSKRCWYLRPTSWKIRWDDSFKNPLIKLLVLRIRWLCKKAEYKLQSRAQRMSYEM